MTRRTPPTRPVPSTGRHSRSTRTSTASRSWPGHPPLTGGLITVATTWGHLGVEPEAGDRFGAALFGWQAPGHDEHVGVGVPGEENGRGLVMFAVPRGPDLTLTYGTAMAGDGYGSALAAGK
ncbi:MAG TPA: hypothetical protein VI076_00575 [Actinopolymorphaceae bacterium]